MHYEYWMHVLPIIIYILLIGIILGIKTIITMDKVDKIADSVNKKIDSLNGLFNVIDFTTEKISSITDRTVEMITGLLGKIFLKHKKNEEEDEDE